MGLPVEFHMRLKNQLKCFVFHIPCFNYKICHELLNRRTEKEFISVITTLDTITSKINVLRTYGCGGRGGIVGDFGINMYTLLYG